MSSVVPHPKMYEELDKFFSQKTITDVDRSTFLVCNLKDPSLKITISLVFLKDWDSLPVDDYKFVIIDECGAIFTLPCYWVSIPKELCFPYFTSIITDFYDNVVSNWECAGSGSSGSNGSANDSINPNLPCHGNNQNGCCCK